MVQKVPKYRGQHHESNNLEERIQFMIVKINILALMSPKRRLIILRECEIKTVHRLYCEAKLPYLNIYWMIILPVDEFIFLLVWALDVSVGVINASSDSWNRSHGIECLLLAICCCLHWQLDPVPYTQHQCISHHSDGTVCCWLINTDQCSHYALEASSCVKTQSQTHLQDGC